MAEKISQRPLRATITRGPQTLLEVHLPRVSEIDRFLYARIYRYFQALVPG